MQKNLSQLKFLPRYVPRRKKVVFNLRYEKDYILRVFHFSDCTRGKCALSFGYSKNQGVVLAATNRNILLKLRVSAIVACHTLKNQEK